MGQAPRWPAPEKRRRRPVPAKPGYSRALAARVQAQDQSDNWMSGQPNESARRHKDDQRGNQHVERGLAMSYVALPEADRSQHDAGGLRESRRAYDFHQQDGTNR